MSYQLIFSGEMRFGPDYYELHINGRKIEGFVYGFSRSEFENGRYLAIEEWQTLDYQNGPITRVAIFDLKNNLVARLKVVDKGFVSGFKLQGNIFSYKEEFHAAKKVLDSEIDFESIKWQPILP
jgi:hypothetical protein